MLPFCNAINTESKVDIIVTHIETKFRSCVVIKSDLATTFLKHKVGAIKVHLL
jgi:hypothetical protein